MTKHNHAIAVHEGHSLLYERTTKYQWGLKKGDVENNCCGGVTIFKFCPLCGVDLSKITAKFLPQHSESKGGKGDE